MFKLVTHVAVLRRCSSIIWDKPEQAAGCASYCHGTQNVGSNRVNDCPLSVRAATMATRAWTKQIVSWISGLSVVKTWSNLSHRVYHPSVSSLRWSLPVIVHSWDGLLTHTQKKAYTSCLPRFNFLSGLPTMLHSDSSPPLAFTRMLHAISIFVKYLNAVI